MIGRRWSGFDYHQHGGLFGFAFCRKQQRQEGIMVLAEGTSGKHAQRGTTRFCSSQKLQGSEETSPESSCLQENEAIACRSGTVERM